MARKKDEDSLIQAFCRLPQAQADSLLDFARYLVERHGVEPQSKRPLDIPRPEEESVLSAIKRLRTTYPMLDPVKLLSETSELMTQHLTQGRDAMAVIDELEVLFRSHYKSVGNKE